LRTATTVWACLRRARPASDGFGKACTSADASVSASVVMGVWSHTPALMRTERPVSSAALSASSVAVRASSNSARASENSSSAARSSGASTCEPRSSAPESAPQLAASVQLDASSASRTDTTTRARETSDAPSSDCFGNASHSADALESGSIARPEWSQLAAIEAAVRWAPLPALAAPLVAIAAATRRALPRASSSTTACSVASRTNSNSARASASSLKPLTPLRSSAALGYLSSTSDTAFQDAALSKLASSWAARSLRASVARVASERPASEMRGNASSSPSDVASTSMATPSCVHPLGSFLALPASSAAVTAASVAARIS